MVLTPAGGFGSAVAGYIRSAVPGDAALDEHTAKIRAYAKEQGLRLTTVIRDEGTSAVAAWRPTFDQLVEDLEEGRYVGVIIPSLDQLGRPHSAALRALDRLRATSAWVTFLDDRGVPSDEEGR